MPCWTPGVPAPSRSDDEQTAHERPAETFADRLAMSTVAVKVSRIGNFAMSITAASALNSCSTDSIAVADSEQTVIVDRDGR
jgi:hypothetical protein